MAEDVLGVDGCRPFAVFERLFDACVQVAERIDAHCCFFVAVRLEVGGGNVPIFRQLEPGVERNVQVVCKRLVAVGIKLDLAVHIGHVGVEVPPFCDLYRKV